jgi:hypothetical protein
LRLFTTSHHNADGAAASAGMELFRPPSVIALRIGLFPDFGGFSMPTNRNVLYLIVGALCVAVVGLGYKVYQDNKQPKGVQLNIGPAGVSIEKK